MLRLPVHGGAMLLNRFFYALVVISVLIPTAVYAYLIGPALVDAPVGQIATSVFLLLAFAAILIALSIGAAAVTYPLRWLQIVAGGGVLALNAAIASSTVEAMIADRTTLYFGVPLIYFILVFLLVAITTILSLLSALVVGWQHGREIPKH